MNKTAIANLNRVKLSYLLLPVTLLILIASFLCINKVWTVENYVNVQSEAFIYTNHNFSKFPMLMMNITQLGDALVILSLLLILIFYIPRIWQCLISASLVSALLCQPLKLLFKMPRPAVVIEKDSFIIIGKAYFGNNSLPSGHSITIFTVFTILLFALMPKKFFLKIIWIILIICTATLIALSRVGLGAHHLLDVVIGSVLGILSGITGILIHQKFCNIFDGFNLNRYYILFIILFVVCSILIIEKIHNNNLPIFYFSLLSILISTYILIKNYVKK